MALRRRTRVERGNDLEAVRCPAVGGGSSGADARFDQDGQSYSPCGGSPRCDAAVTLRLPSECRVERIHVYVGKLVSEGDPVAELSSAALTHAKNGYRSKAARWESDHERLRSRQQRSTSDYESQRLLVDAQKDESRSLLEFQIARRRLAVWGLDDQEIKAVADERGEQHGRLTLRSPIKGIVVEIKGKAGGLYDSKSALMDIFPPSAHRTSFYQVTAV